MPEVEQKLRLALQPAVLKAEAADSIREKEKLLVPIDLLRASTKEQKIDMLVHWFREKLVRFVDETPGYFSEIYLKQNTMKIQFGDYQSGHRSSEDRNLQEVMERVLADSEVTLEPEDSK